MSGEVYRCTVCEELREVCASHPWSDLIARLESLAQKYRDNGLENHERGVRHALREVKCFAPEATP